jgi:signal transduction histidine kinase
MNAALTRIYERLGPHYIPAVVAGLAVTAVFVQLPLALWLEVRYLDASAEQYWKLTAFGIPIVSAALAVGLAVSLQAIAPPYRWLRAGRPLEMAPEVWRRSVRAGFMVVNRGALAIAIAIIPYHLFISPAVLDVDIGVGVAMVLFGEVAVVTGWLILQFVVDLALRPVIRDLASQLPEAPDAPLSGWRLRSKAITTVPVAAFYGAFAAGAFVLHQATPEAQLYTALAAAAVVTLVFAGPVAAIATGSVLDPVNDLIAATKRIRHGDVSTPVPILTDDELGELARSFNRMLAGLREREELRERNLELVNELQASRARIVASSAEARRKVERDLHDGAQQHLILLKLKLGMVERELRKDPEAGARMARTALDDLDRALAELRDLAHGIYPAVLTSDGLPAALEQAAEQAAIPATLSSNGTGRYRPELEAAVYFCCLEALQNSAKHAGDGATAKVSISQENGELRFEVADDGVGFDADAAAESSGIQNMADRIGALGGELRVESAPGGGTRIAGSVPTEG